ncbi:MAG: phage Gp37/Gp68 family protein [Candidatus Parabeggiatoa sp.]|nr:phage Gp37/Gp68 family protein [Candidatus Parabeggiatoa sp.]
MSQQSKIEWTQNRWNPTTECTKISSGCKHCNSETMAKRLRALGVRGYENGFDLSILPERLEQPLKRKKPTLYFVNSMSDLFHEDIPDSFIEDVFKVITQATQHEFQILTKRASRMAEFFQTRQVPKNAWLGVTVEDKKYGLTRIDHLRRIDVNIRFLSLEPLLENVGKINLTGIHWVIVGGESGAKARPMKKKWALNIQQQCQQSDVQFFFKQWGMWGDDGKKRPKKQNGRQLNGKIFDEMPYQIPIYG